MYVKTDNIKHAVYFDKKRNGLMIPANEQIENNIETLQIWTIGHSTRKREDLTDILKQNQIEVLADIRSFPRSFRNPQFNTEILAEELPKAGIEYVWLKGLGGRRKGLGKASKNNALRSPAFRNYADYMETEEFEKSIEELLKIAKEGTGKRVAIMCAESLYWNCHRMLVSDYLTFKGIKVTHILSKNKTEEHKRSSFSRIVIGELSYEKDKTIDAFQTKLTNTKQAG